MMKRQLDGSESRAKSDGLVAIRPRVDAATATRSRRRAPNSRSRITGLCVIQARYPPRRHVDRWRVDNYRCEAALLASTNWHS